ncbi:hypothetical protein STFE110948_04405 [Streptobacillus felis]|uniref:hypothetical protein n=1 Tax=Streptobacillus felis TaxID=1384509 RepID=UPI00082C79E8|nr:hypothetical protein [Streptobacillus felis]
MNGHALYALGMFKDYSLIEKIKPFLSHKITFKRTIAKKAIAKLEKQKKLREYINKYVNLKNIKRIKRK